MPENVEPQGVPIVITKVTRSPFNLRTKFTEPLLSKYQALDWQSISFDIPRDKLIILGLSVVGIAGLYVLVRTSHLSLPKLRQNLQARQPKETKEETSSKLGRCKFGFQDM